MNVMFPNGSVKTIGNLEFLLAAEIKSYYTIMKDSLDIGVRYAEGKFEYREVDNSEFPWRVSTKIAGKEVFLCSLSELPGIGANSEIIHLNDTPRYVKADLTIPVDPLDIKTSKFTPREILYHHDGFVIASGKWEDNALDSLACRWHEAHQLGYPNGFGKPQWMALPASMEDVRKSTNPIIPDMLTITFKGAYDVSKVGQFVRTADGWHMVTYVHGNGTEIVNVMGLGKSDNYPISVPTICEIQEAKSSLAKWHAGKSCLWFYPGNGTLFATYRYDGYDDGSEQTNNGNVFSIRKVQYLTPFQAPPMWALTGHNDLCYLYQLDGLILIKEESGIMNFTEVAEEFIASIESVSLTDRFQRVKFVDDLADEEVSVCDILHGTEFYIKLK